MSALESLWSLFLSDKKADRKRKLVEGDESDSAKKIKLQQERIGQLEEALQSKDEENSKLKESLEQTELLEELFYPTHTLFMKYRDEVNEIRDELSPYLHQRQVGCLSEDTLAHVLSICPETYEQLSQANFRSDTYDPETDEGMALLCLFAEKFGMSVALEIQQVREEMVEAKISEPQTVAWDEIQNKPLLSVIEMLRHLQVRDLQ